MAKKVANRASGSGRWGSPRAEFVFRKLEATPRIELGMEVLQTSALPLGYVAARSTILAADPDFTWSVLWSRRWLGKGLAGPSPHAPQASVGRAWTAGGGPVAAESGGAMSSSCLRSALTPKNQ